MPDMVVQGPKTEERRRGDCSDTGINANKIFDACRDKDCVEDLRVYPTVSSQTLINSAISVRPSSATLLSAEVNVDAISFKRGYYTVDVTFFYRVTGTTFPGSGEVVGLAVFDKRVILFGSESAVKVFSSETVGEPEVRLTNDLPEAVVAAVDPIALNMRLVDPSTPPVPDAETPVIPDYILDAIGEELVMNGNGRRLYVTLGQFSVIRLERPTMMRLDADSYLPEQECPGSSDDDPCTLFSQVNFPFREFVPPDEPQRHDDYRDLIQ